MNRGEIWQINLDPTVGAEIKKMRPSVIVSRDSVGVLPLRVIVPLTEWKADFSKSAWLVHIEPSDENGLQKESTADTFQVRSVSLKRFIEKIGRLSDEDMNRVSEGLAGVLDI